MTEAPDETGSDAHVPQGVGGADDRPYPWARAIECAVIFGVGPGVLDLRVLNRALIPLLFAMAAICLLVLLLDRSFDKRSLWRWRGLRRELRWMLLKFAVGASMIAAFTAIVVPERMFGFVRSNPEVFIMVMLLYPIFSVYPQEVIYRAFFFHRYRRVFTNPWAMIVASGVAFGWAHVVLENWIAVALSTIGGLLFAWTYQRSRSTAAACVEHALYGDFIWLIGLGAFFYAGNV